VDPEEGDKKRDEVVEGDDDPAVGVFFLPGKNF
jgi:hypothetical protein